MSDDPHDLATEIERLRADRAAAAAEIVRLQGELSTSAMLRAGEERKEMRAEIMRLQGELQACGLDNEAYFNRCEEQAAEIVRLRTGPSQEFVDLLQDQVSVLRNRCQRFEAEIAQLQEQAKLGWDAASERADVITKSTMEFVKVAAIAEREIARLQAELELERRRLTTSEALRTGLIEVLDRHERALDRYRYATVFAAAEAWDCGLDMRARFGWARALDRKEMTDDEVAAIGKQYLDWEGGQ